ncbi:hypothetical protein DBR43_30175 [Pedobacter sp. KBW06]|uniref:hypothetical protein n=1 Tax=Pedobacter sp. KBW06 TaxID=2153359 RepID=UPI000F5B81E1|nr:hypothetical protein [Pedobacter sp. KBW06]RQO66477.1 hypothetical protein DBR43_30175 [Pedobacter sp. KBW06]
MKNKLPFVFLLVILMSLIYKELNGLRFANVDDQWMLLDDVLVRPAKFDPEFLKKVFTNINSLQYAPLNTLYYYLIYKINGYDPYWYHLISFFVHVLNTALIYTISKTIFRLFHIGNVTVLAYVVTVLWAILPFNVESVVWISASKILLFSFFGLLSFMWFIKAYVNGSKGYYVASILAFTLAFLAKEQAVLLSLMFLVFRYCYDRQYDQVNLKKTIVYLLPFMVLSLVFGLVTVYAAVYGDGSHDIARYPFYQRIVLTFYCLCFYVFNLFVPIDLHYHYPFPNAAGQALPLKFYVYPVVFGLLSWQLTGLLKGGKNFNFYLLCIGIFFAHLLLSIQVFPLARAAVVADRYMYLSSFGLLMMAVVALGENIRFEQLTFSNKAIIGGFAVYVVAIAYYSFNLVNNWQGMNL